ncbi:MAG: DNA/RNA nuclease SfsA [Oscillospiraceae bacterium]|nr:DNA/RNA nuclease SfsA [Oscillospiraceae bacterium]
MKYDNIFPGEFISRPNRFIANISINGQPEVCHVKNTGRCRELLIPGSSVFVQRSKRQERKTKYDLISVYKGNMLINMDSQAPNKVFGEWANGGYFGTPTLIRPEYRYKNSRFDFYIETSNRKIFVEVKGVTLEENGVVLFPDAPTERGVKHIRELCDAVNDGYEAYIFFIAQMGRAKLFRPNRRTHPEFAEALLSASKNGVNVACLNCRVTPDTLEIMDHIKTELEE